MKVNLNTQTEKRLDISGFKDSMKGIEEGDYLTIKKLTLKERRIVEMTSFMKGTSQFHADFLQAVSALNKKPEQITNEEYSQILKGMNLTDKAIVELASSFTEREYQTLELAIDEDKHSFTDMQGKPIKLTIEVLLNIGTQLFIKYLLDEINKLYKDEVPGENISDK
jgi:hypothetical protein